MASVTHVEAVHETIFDLLGAHAGGLEGSNGDRAPRAETFARQRHEHTFDRGREPVTEKDDPRRLRGLERPHGLGAVGDGRALGKKGQTLGRARKRPIALRVMRLEPRAHALVELESRTRDASQYAAHTVAGRAADARHDGNHAGHVEHAFERDLVVVDDDVRAHPQTGGAERRGERDRLGMSAARHRGADAHDADAGAHGHPVSARSASTTTNA